MCVCVCVCVCVCMCVCVCVYECVCMRACVHAGWPPEGAAYFKPFFVLTCLKRALHRESFLNFGPRRTHDNLTNHGSLLMVVIIRYISCWFTCNAAFVCSECCVFDALFIDTWFNLHSPTPFLPVKFDKMRMPSNRCRMSLS